MEERLWTVEEVAEYLKVQPRTVRDWIKAGQLEAMFLGRRAGYRVTDGDLRAFLQRTKKDAARVDLAA